VNFSRKGAYLLVLAGIGIFPIALAAQDSNGRVEKPSPSSVRKLAGPEQKQETTSDLPAWAYGFDNTTEGPPPDSPDSEARGGKDNGALRHLPGSTQAFTLTQIRDNSGPADWYPNDHPAMPDIVAHGHKPEVVACSFCHYPQRKRPAGKHESRGSPLHVYLADVGRLQERCPQERGHQEGQHKRDDWIREVHE